MVRGRHAHPAGAEVSGKQAVEQRLALVVQGCERLVQQPQARWVEGEAGEANTAALTG
jgi:hypothetical protein